MPISMLRPTRWSTIPLQSRKTPRKDAPPQPAAHHPPRKPREWLTPRFKEQFAASNDELLVKKGDTATTSMVNREALTGPSSVCLPSCTAGVSGALVASLSSRANASPCTSPTQSLPRRGRRNLCGGGGGSQKGEQDPQAKKSKSRQEEISSPAACPLAHVQCHFPFIESEFLGWLALV